MTIRKENALLADRNQNPLIGAAQTAIADLSMSVGTGDNAVADVGAAFNQTTLNNNFRDLTDKVNAILAALRAHGLIRT